MALGTSFAVLIKTRLAPRSNLSQNKSPIPRSSGSNQQKLTLRSLKRRNFLALAATFLGTIPSNLACYSIGSAAISWSPSLTSLLAQLVLANEFANNLTNLSELPKPVVQQRDWLEKHLIELAYQDRVTAIDTIRLYLTEKIRVDYENASTVKVKGWHLANTEAALIALASKYRPV